jgi:hypothetical protein
MDQIIHKGAETYLDHSALLVLQAISGRVVLPFKAVCSGVFAVYGENYSCGFPNALVS